MKWYVLYTRHHHERAVYERLLGRGFQAYLPGAVVWRKTKYGIRKAWRPLLPRYVFVRCYLEMYAQLELIGIPGVMRILEDAEGQLLVISEEEMRILRRLNDAGLPLEQVSYQSEGEQVEVVHGPLKGMIGMMPRGPGAALLIPIRTLRTCIAVEVNRTQVAPASAGMESLSRPLSPR